MPVFKPPRTKIYICFPTADLGSDSNKPKRAWVSVMKIMQASSWKQVQNIFLHLKISKKKWAQLSWREAFKRNPRMIYNEDDRPALSTSPCHAHGAGTGAASLDVSPFCKGLWSQSFLRRICILKPITGCQLTVDLSTTHRSQFLINSRRFRFSPTNYICLNHSCSCPAHLGTNGDFLIFLSFSHATRLEWR